MYISGPVARLAEQDARKQRVSFAYLLRSDESKAPTSADILRLRRLIAAAQKRSITYGIFLASRRRRGCLIAGRSILRAWKLAQL